MATTAFQKILSNLSTNPNVKKLVENFNQLSSELMKKEKELKKSFGKQKDEKFAMALKKYNEVLKSLNGSEKKLAKEVNVAVTQIKKSAGEVKKDITNYKKKAMAQKAKIEKSLFAKKAAAKKTSKKVASTVKKTSKKVAKKTSKKVSAAINA